ncbi:MAG TPA: hemolysin family protein [Jiangellaceae bacterium]|nr:hemolysin family protein [Jiangellaceae bacterium]
MSGEVLANVGLVLLFVLIGGVFAATEIALVSLRDSQLTQLAQRGRRGTRVAALARNPNRFLSAVQIGVTAAGFFSAAFGATTLADDLAPVLVGWGLGQTAAELIALIGITLAIVYVSLVLGELAPKRVALQRAVSVSMVVAPPLDRFATLMRPVIWLLSKSTDVVIRLLGGDPAASREEISEEELREMLTAHQSLGEEERKIVEDVFATGDRQVREVMRPRTEVDFLDAAMPVYQAVKTATTMPHSRYPVVRGSADDVVGFVHVRDLFSPEIANTSVRVGEIARDLLMLPDTKRVLPAMSEMRRVGGHIAVVVDEYGGTAGIVTLEDLVEELVGEIRDEYDTDELPARSTEGEVEVDGLLNIEDFAEQTGVELPDGPYETVAGYVAAVLGRLPDRGDTIEIDGHSLEVVVLDGRRVARLRLTAVPTPEQAPAEPRKESAGPGADRLTE